MEAEITFDFISQYYWVHSPSGKFIKDGFDTLDDAKVWCKQNNYEVKE